MHQITFTAREQAELVESPDWEGPPGPDQVQGRTLVSLVSPGTEINYGYSGNQFPSHPGYACIFEVEETGSHVTHLRPGTRLFSQGCHAGKQRVPAHAALELPPGLAPEAAVFARLMSVSMSTLNTAAAHPPAHVLVTGLGPVGNLASQIFSHCGYRVTSVDPVESRRKTAAACGLSDVRAQVTDDLVDSIALHVECSGHEKAILDGCRCVKKRGEVVLVGVPWQRRTEITAFELLNVVFHRYIILRSGWEWEIPWEPRDFSFHSISDNSATALAWLAAGKIQVDGLAARYSPTEAQDVYEGLYKQTLPTATAIFDWQKLL